MQRSGEAKFYADLGIIWGSWQLVMDLWHNAAAVVGRDPSRYTVFAAVVVLLTEGMLIPKNTRRLDNTKNRGGTNVTLDSWSRRAACYAALDLPYCWRVRLSLY